MTTSGLITSLLGQGVDSDRPASPNIAPGAIALWYSTNTNEASIWADGAWIEDFTHVTLADGDYGDVTISGSGAIITIDAGTVTLAKQANVATGTVFYRKTAGTGVPEVQTLATLKTDLGLTGTNSGDQTTIVGITGTLSEFNTALTGADFATGGGTATGTNTGDQTSIVGIAGTKAQFDTAVSDGNIVYVGDAASSVTNALTITNTGGAVAGATYNGSAAKTIDYSTVGAAASTAVDPLLSAFMGAP